MSTQIKQNIQEKGGRGKEERDNRREENREMGGGRLQPQADSDFTSFHFVPKLYQNLIL